MHNRPRVTISRETAAPAPAPSQWGDRRRLLAAPSVPDAVVRDCVIGDETGDQSPPG
ncbi:MAG: hypothetical protein ACLR8R_10005 [Oscillospiraceae bacterium]